jgi:release factor glutamine methyltransferase
MEKATIWTIGSLLTWATSDFRERGMESPRLEAEILLAHVLGVDRIRLIVESGRPLSTDELNAYKAKFKRRRSGEPTAYILGQREFFGRSFEVNPHVLVPRPDTEILVQVALDRTSHRKLTGRALDLCTGSGCVAVSFALERRTWHVTASDVSERAIEVARKNALRLGAIWGLRFLVSDLFGAVDQGERYELVTANPPYIPIGDHKDLDPTVRDFEPALALVGGEDGLDLYPRLIRQARRHLVPGGVLAVEVGAGQAAAVEQLFIKEGFSALSREKDYGGHERVVSGKANTDPS